MDTLRSLSAVSSTLGTKTALQLPSEADEGQGAFYPTSPLAFNASASPPDWFVRLRRANPTFFASLTAQPGHRLNVGSAVAQEGYPGSGSAPELQLPLRYDESSNARNEFGTVDVQQQTDPPNRLGLPVKECQDLPQSSGHRNVESHGRIGITEAAIRWAWGPRWV